MNKMAAVLLGLALAPAAAAAAEEDYISVFVDYLAVPSSSHDPELKDGIGADVRYGKFVGDAWGYELRGFYGTLQPETSTETGFHGGLAANATYRFGELWTVRPYLVIGGLLAYADLATGTQNDPRAGLMIDAGGGIWSRPFLEIFGRGLSARAEARGAYEYYQEGYLDVRAYLGLSMPISAKAEPAPEPVQVVQAVTEPAAEPIPEPPVEPCKTPEPGEKVSLKGCGTGDVLVLRGITFDFDKATLTANAKVLLDDVVQELAKYPDIKIEVGGHTDAKGSDAYNQSLSERRAAAVVSYFESKGIAADRMTSAGYGEAQPVADNESDEGREKNRRVELKVTEGTAAERPAETSAPAEPATSSEPSTPGEHEVPSESVIPSDPAEGEPAPSQ
jgi:outer membrane protein OmpA-like peptidoglycan-associated protein